VLVLKRDQDDALARLGVLQRHAAGEPRLSVRDISSRSDFREAQVVEIEQVCEAIARER